MAECATGSHVTEMLVRLGVVFILHAAPLAYVFVRWGHRFYWGFFPAAFSALAAVVYTDFNSPCAISQSEFNSIMLGTMLVSVSYLSLILFKPDLHLGPLFGQAHVPVVLASPIFGALYAAVWLLLSIRRNRLLMDTGETVTLRIRIFETLAHSVVVIAGLMLLASIASK